MEQTDFFFFFDTIVHIPWSKSSKSEVPSFQTKPGSIFIFNKMKTTLLTLIVLSTLLEESVSFSTSLISSLSLQTSWGCRNHNKNGRIPFVSTINDNNNDKNNVVLLRASTTPVVIEEQKEEKVSYILTELRTAAMKLHTRQQSPKEGEATDTTTTTTKEERYIPTINDYLQYLIDSQYVFQTMENIVNTYDELKPIRNTGLERTIPLETDIQYILSEFQITNRPTVGQYGIKYSTHLQNTIQKSLPEFMCHYFNYYFAHTAGGRMIGKQMSSLLLNKKTLEFYKWDGDINEMKETVKGIIEDMASTWSTEQKKECVNGTPAAFQGGGSINSYLSSGVKDSSR